MRTNEVPYFADDAVAILPEYLARTYWWAYVLVGPGRLLLRLHAADRLRLEEIAAWLPHTAKALEKTTAFGDLYQIVTVTV